MINFDPLMLFGIVIVFHIIRKPKWKWGSLKLGASEILVFCLFTVLAYSTAKFIFNSNLSCQSTAWLRILFIAPVVEEIFFRQILFSKVKKYTNLNFSVILTSFLFSFGHFYHQGLISSMIIFFLGIIFQFFYIKNGLILSILAHVAYNFISLIFSCNFPQ